MKTLRIAGLALMLMGARLFAQTSSLPQVFSPNAAELGKYGKIPVNYYNGLPNISIPLTELKAKDYTLPVYLTYHASGNKPDQHPGWVGLGWTLHAGGCINRIVNGEIDELCQEEQAELNARDQFNYPTISSIIDPGYMFKGYAVQEDSVIHVEKMSQIEYTLIDKEPDEFQVSVDGLEASFYFTGEGGIRIKSQNDVDFSINVDLSDSHYIEMYPSENPPAGGTYRTVLYRHIKAIELTASNGVKYLFGGDYSAIEVSSTHLGQLTYTDNGDPLWRNPIGHVNTWHLQQIQFPNGEIISFEYEQSGIPIVKYGCYSHWSYTYAGVPYSSSNSISPSDYDSYSFLFPCYLKTITSAKGKDAISFSTGHTQELSYAISEIEMAKKTGVFTDYHPFSQFMEKNYYLQLNTLSKKGESIHFHYSHSSSHRLQLNRISFSTSSGQSKAAYTFDYNGNGNLPGYNSRKTDMWGHYRGHSYSMFTPENMNQTRTAVFDSTIVGILETIHYPTGGWTAFEYEPNDYTFILNEDSLTTMPTSSGNAGGVRIKRITDYDGARTTSRTFIYQDEQGNSSGILCATPKFFLHDYFIRNETRFKQYQSGGPSLWHQLFDLEPDEDGLEEFTVRSEQYINELTLTHGSHISYSRVVERFDDGSCIVRKFSSFKDFPDDKPILLYGNYNGAGIKYKTGDKDLSRGLLIQEQYLTENGTIRKAIDYDYNHTREESPLGAVDYSHFGSGYFIFRFHYYRVYSYFPYLRTKTITTYPDTGTPHVETFEYTYDEHRRLKETKRTVAGITDRETFTYTGDYEALPYSSMKARNMVSLPVEHLTFHKNSPSAAEKVIGAELTTWKSSGTMFVPLEEWNASLGSGVSTTSFTPYTGETKDTRYGDLPEYSFEEYDTHANPVLVRDRSGSPTTYIWDMNGVHPVLIARDAMNGPQTLTVPGTNTASESDNYSSVRQVVKQFISTEHGPFSLRFIPEVPASVITTTLDGDTLALQTLSAFGGPILEYSYQTHPGSSNDLPAGEHEIIINCLPAPQVAPTGSTQNATNGLVIHPIPFSGTLHISYSIHGLRAQSLDAEDLFFEDFEASSESEEGYQSDKGHTGNYTVSLPNLNPYREHVLDYWTRTGTGPWTYIRIPFNGSATIGGPGVTVDQVRVYPTDASIENYTWDSRGNLRSRTDGRGVTESYTYDALGRLSGVYDNNGDKVEGYEYNYKNR